MERPTPCHLWFGQLQLSFQIHLFPEELEGVDGCGPNVKSLAVGMQAKIRHVRPHQWNLARLGHVVVGRRAAVSGIRHKRVVVSHHSGSQKVNASRTVKPPKVQRQVASHRAQTLVQRISRLGRRSGESEAVILHQAKGLNQVWHDATGQQFPLKHEVFLLEIVQAVNHKRIHSIVEIVSVVCATTNHVSIVVHMRNLPARENGILGVPIAFPSRLVVGVVDLQRARHLFNGAFNPTQQGLAIRVKFSIDFRFDSEGLSHLHLQLERIVVKRKTRP